MTFIDQVNTLKRIDGLVRRKATGTPEQLSDRLALSRASVYRYIATMKELGAPIDYCKLRRTFYYKQDYTLKF